jgi:hypothetical protein
MSGHFRRRGKRQEQQIALIRKLWEQPVVHHEGSDHRIDRAGILPPETEDPDLAGRFQRGRVRPGGQDRGRIPFFGPDSDRGDPNQGEDRG